MTSIPVRTRVFDASPLGCDSSDFSDVRERGNRTPFWSSKTLWVLHKFNCELQSRQEILQPSSWGNCTCLTGWIP
ncbi:hypothetical protein LguiA_027650 [Lonicera macranthoides]